MAGEGDNLRRHGRLRRHKCSRGTVRGGGTWSGGTTIRGTIRSMNGWCLAQWTHAVQRASCTLSLARMAIRVRRDPCDIIHLRRFSKCSCEAKMPGKDVVYWSLDIWRPLYVLQRTPISSDTSSQTNLVHARRAVVLETNGCLKRFPEWAGENLILS